MVEKFPLFTFEETPITGCAHLTQPPNQYSITIKGIGSDDDSSSYKVEIYVKDVNKKKKSGIEWFGSSFISSNDFLGDNFMHFFEPNIERTITFDDGENLYIKLTSLQDDSKLIKVVLFY